MNIIGWAVVNNLGQIDSYYETLGKAKERAKEKAQSGNTVRVVELRVMLEVTAVRGEWTYIEKEIK